MNDTPDDEPRILDEIQARQEITDFAGLARHMYLCLLAEGFTEQQALTITIAKCTAQA